MVLGDFDDISAWVQPDSIADSLYLFRLQHGWPAKFAWFSQHHEQQTTKCPYYFDNGKNKMLNKIYFVDIHDRLAEARTSARFSQREAAKTAGISHGMIANLETAGYANESNPRHRATFKLLAKLYNVTEEYLWSGSGIKSLPTTTYDDGTIPRSTVKFLLEIACDFDQPDAKRASAKEELIKVLHLSE